jgi:hypothetical protein
MSVSILNPGKKNHRLSDNKGDWAGHAAGETEVSFQEEPHSTNENREGKDVTPRDLRW